MNLSGRFEILEVLEKTRANGWSKAKAGDIITISLQIVSNTHLGSSGYTSHQVYPLIRIEGTDIEWNDSFSRIAERITKTFKMKQLN